MEKDNNDWKENIICKALKEHNWNQYTAEGIILQTVRTRKLTFCREEVLQWLSCQS